MCAIIRTNWFLDVFMNYIIFDKSILCDYVSENLCNIILYVNSFLLNTIMYK